MSGKDIEYWYRADDRRYADYDPYEDYNGGSHLVTTVTRYEVIKHTPKGVWIKEWGFPGKRFICGNTAKQFVVPTVELALSDLVARKKAHVRGCKARLNTAEEHLKAAEHFLIEEQKNPLRDHRYGMCGAYHKNFRCS